MKPLAQLAHELNVSTETIRRIVRARRLPHGLGVPARMGRPGMRFTEEDEAGVRAALGEAREVRRVN